MRSKNTPSPRELLVFGSSWHASVVIDAIELAGEYTITGYLDDTVEPGTCRKQHTVLGGLRDAPHVCKERAVAHAVLAIGDNWWRRKIAAELKKTCPKLQFPSIRHPSATVARSARIGNGSVILADSHVGSVSTVGDFCILNTKSSVDHDCILHDFASLAPGAVTGGLVEIGECSAIGVGASISDRIRIGKHSLIGTGSTVVGDIPDLAVAYGNPARVQRTRTEGEEYLGARPQHRL